MCVCVCVCALKQVWSKDDFKFLREKLKDFPYSHYFHRQAVNSQDYGMCLYNHDEAPSWYHYMIIMVVPLCGPLDYCGGHCCGN